MGFFGLILDFWTPKSVLPFAKHICFGWQNTVFCLAKHGLLEGESLAFASETYMFQKLKG